MVDLPITKWIKKKIRRLIGIVEDTDVATHSIASGKYVIWKGDLYKSTAAIAVGGSLSLSNLSPVSDGGLNELSEHLATETGTISTNTGACSYSKTGNVVTVRYQSLSNVLNVGRNITDVTIPSGYRPKNPTYGSGVANAAGTTIVCMLTNSDGSITIIMPNETNYVDASVTYII